MVLTVSSRKATFFIAKRFLILLFAYLWRGCANVVAPTGGEKDNQPPFLVSVSPRDSQTHFYPKTITFTFNEWILINDPQRAILISPPTDAIERIWSANKKLRVRLKSNLQPNTTYTLLVGKGVTDFTEKNPALPYIYRFSTGAHMDTGTIKGTLFHYQGLKPLDDFLILLYPLERFDSDSLPTSLSRSFEGHFTVTGLKVQPYFVFAVQDKDGNLRYTPGEWIALPEQKTTTPNDSITLYAFLPDEKGPLLKQWKIAQDSTSITFLFNEPISSLSISFPNFFSIPKVDREKAIIYLKKPFLDSAAITLVIRDTLFNETDTTLLLPPLHPQSVPSLSFHFQLDPLEKSLIITPSIPVPQSQIAKHILIRDSLTLFRPVLKEWKPYAFTIDVSPMEPNHTYWITVDTLLTSIFDTHPDTLIQWTFRIPPSPEPATIEGTIIDPDTLFASYWLISSHNDTFPVNRIVNQTVFKEGTYQIWKLVDRNQNGRWDNGNLSTWQPPEIWIPFEPILHIYPGWQYRNIQFTPKALAPSP